MTCEEIDDLLQGFIDDELSPLDHKIVTVHHRSCDTCSENYQDALSVIRLLKNLEVPPATPDFASRVIANATATERQPSARKSSRIPVAIAASFIFIALISVILIQKFPAQNDVVLLNGNEIRVVKLAIDSAHAIDGVKITIDMSDNLEISGYENLKQISWKASLSKGTNVIALPISALASGDGEITAQVRVGDEVKIFKIKTRNQPLDKVRRNDSNFLDA